MIEVLILHLPGDQLILKIPDILMVNLNNAADLSLEDPRKFLMVLVVLTQHEDLAGELVFLVLPLEELRVLVEEDLVLEEGEVAVMVVLVHLFDAVDVGCIVAVVAMAREQRIKSRACHATKVNVINLITKIYKHSLLFQTVTLILGNSIDI